MNNGTMHHQHSTKPRHSTRDPYVDKACDRCRSRKTKCSGDSPACQSCQRSKRRCIYSTEADRRKYSKVSRSKTLELQEEIKRLETALYDSRRKLKVDWPSSSSSSAYLLPTFQHTPTFVSKDPFSPPLSVDGSKDATNLQPISIGRLILSKNGCLHIDAETTFYRPGIPFMVPGSHTGNDRLLDLGSHSYQTSGVASRDAHKSSYMPLQMDEDFHRRLIDLCFDYGVSYGMNAFKDEFLAALHTGSGNAHYFSPLLHLSCLSNGYRYLSTSEQTSYRRTLGGLADEDPGMILMAKARSLAEIELCEPSLATIIGLLWLSHSCFGMSLDRVGTTYYSMAVSLSQEFRVHQRCDEQLQALDLAPGCELDAVRRDVCAFVQIYSCWWIQYVARLTVPVDLLMDQRDPILKQDFDGSEDPNRSSTSEAFTFHASLSRIGIDLFYCNHVWKMDLDRRIAIVQQILKRLQAWRASLPERLQWPQSNTGETLLHPSIATLIVTYNAYVIQLLRPYITIQELDGLEFVPVQLCVQAAEEVVDLIRFIRDYHGSQFAPLCLQMMTSIVGTFLVLQASGLANVSTAAVGRAKRHLPIVLRWLDEFAGVWPTTAHAAESLRRLTKEYCVSSTAIASS